MEVVASWRRIVTTSWTTTACQPAFPRWRSRERGRVVSVRYSSNDPAAVQGALHDLRREPGGSTPTCRSCSNCRSLLLDKSVHSGWCGSAR
jgi:hypothetical protein